MNLQEFNGGLNKCREQDLNLAGITTVLIEWNEKLYRFIGTAHSRIKTGDIAMISLSEIRPGFMGPITNLGEIQAMITFVDPELLKFPLYVDVPDEQLICDVQSVEFHLLQDTLLIKIF